MDNVVTNKAELIKPLLKEVKKITHGQLFGGIFGFGLSAQWAGIENVWYNDNDHFCCEVVRARIRDGQIKDKVKIHECDIKNIGKHNLESVDIISAGVPCQPASVAGKRKGKDDDRWLWPEALRVCREIEPSFIIFENPPGILTLDAGNPFNEILLALESQGYKIEIFNIPAASKKAWHRRDRIWILAYSGCRDTWQSGNAKEVSSERHGTENSSGKACRSGSNDRKRVVTNANSTQRGSNKRESDTETNRGNNIGGICQDAPNSTIQRLQRGIKTNKIKRQKYNDKQFNGCNRKWNESRKQWKIESCVGGVASRLPPELDGYWDKEPENVPRVAKGVKDRANRIKGLGNAVVPQIPYIFFRIISQILNNLKIKTA